MPILDAAASLRSFDSSIDSIRHGIYNRLGRRIGYYDNLATLAAGRKGFWTVTNGQAPAPSELYVRTWLGQLVSVTDYLLSKGYRPSWADASSVAAAETRVALKPPPKAPPVIAPPAPTTAPPATRRVLDLNPFDGDGIGLRTPAEESARRDAQSYQSLLLYGATAVIGLALIFSGGRR